jgi:hypothetical protein
MTINKAAFAAGDKNEMLKLARTIKKSAPTDKNAHPMASQFFDEDPSSVRPIDTSALLENSAGAESVEHFRWVEALAAGGYEAIATHLDRPSRTASVTQIGTGGLARSGWTPPQPVNVSGTEKILAAKLSKAASALPAHSRAALERVGTTESADDHGGLLAETLKAVCIELLGLSVENFDTNTLKTKLASAFKSARPELRKRLFKALAMAA